MSGQLYSQFGESASLPRLPGGGEKVYSTANLVDGELVVCGEIV